MILECPSCTAKFHVPDESLGEEGRRVRCGKCQFIWKAMPEQMAEKAAAALAEMVEEAQGPTDASSSAAPDIDQLLAAGAGGKAASKATGKAAAKKEVSPEELLGDYKPPVKQESRGMRRAAYGAAYVVLLAVIAGLVSLLDPARWWGIEPSAGLSFETIELNPMQKIGGDRFSNVPTFSITGTARNVSDVPKTLPLISVSLVSLTGEVVYKKNYQNNNKIVPPGETVNFLLENLEQPDPNHTQFVVELGNRVELALRNGTHGNEH